MGREEIARDEDAGLCIQGWSQGEPGVGPGVGPRVGPGGARGGARGGGARGGGRGGARGGSRDQSWGGFRNRPEVDPVLRVIQEWVQGSSRGRSRTQGGCRS